MSASSNPALKIHRRGDWDAPPLPAGIPAVGVIRAVTIHRTESSDDDPQPPAERLRAWETEHRAKYGLGPGYHFLIDRQGGIWEGVPLALKGAHTRAVNTGNVGIALFGTARFTLDQQANLLALLRWLADAHPATLGRESLSWIRGHCEWPTASTDCPGPALMALVRAIRHTKEINL